MSLYLTQMYLTAGIIILEVLRFQFNTVLTGMWASYLRIVEKSMDFVGAVLFPIQHLLGSHHASLKPISVSLMN